MSEKEVIEFRFSDGRTEQALCPAGKFETLHAILEGSVEVARIEPDEGGERDFVHGALYDDPVYKPGRFYVVGGPFEGAQEVKMCVAVFLVPYGKKTCRKIMLHDGTFISESKGPFVNSIWPLSARNFWMFEAQRLFPKVLDGQLKRMTVELPDGTVVFVERRYKARPDPALGHTVQLDLEGRRKPEAVIRYRKRTVVVGKDWSRNYREQDI